MIAHARYRIAALTAKIHLAMLQRNIERFEPAVRAQARRSDNC